MNDELLDLRHRNLEQAAKENGHDAVKTNDHDAAKREPNEGASNRWFETAHSLVRSRAVSKLGEMRLQQECGHFARQVHWVTHESLRQFGVVAEKWVTHARAVRVRDSQDLRRATHRHGELDAFESAAFFS